MTAPDLLTRFKVDDSLLYRPFASLWALAIERAAREGCDVYRVGGTREYAEQQVDWLKGRLTVGPNATRDRPLGDTVTGARPGESGHCFGICGDGTKDKDNAKPGLQPDYDPLHYEPYGRNARQVGLDAGFYWEKRKGDAAHVGLNIASKKITLPMLKVIFERRGKTDMRAGLADTWMFLDRAGPWGVP